MTLSTQTSSYVFLADRLEQLPQLLRGAFEHPWIGTYQIGFGPPLVKSSERIVERLKSAKTALEKLDAYLEVCILDDEERKRLATLHRHLLVRRHGPLEAEAVQKASADVIDLMIRLHSPYRAPAAVRASMDEAGVDLGWVAEDAPPEALSGRFWVHLSDPANERVLYADAVREAAGDDKHLALELRVPAAMRPFWSMWVSILEDETGYPVVDLGEPTAHARVRRDGQAL